MNKSFIIIPLLPNFRILNHNFQSKGQTMANQVHKHFKNGSSFRFKGVAYDSAKANRGLNELKKEQEGVNKSAKVDLETMRKVKFTI